MNFDKKLLLIFASLFFVDKSGAQPTYSYGINPYYGGVFRYKKDMPVLEFTNLYGLEVFFHKQTDGSRPWEALYNYPKIGVALAHYNYGEPEELGKVYSATTYLDFTYSPEKRTNLRINLGTGVVYSDVKYDPESNPENKAISATLSYVIRGTFYYSIWLNKHWNFNINAAFRHFSNGRMQMPNNGMNFPVAGIGLEYIPDPDIEFIEREKSAFDKKLRFNLYGATAWREVHYIDIKHKAYTISGYISKRVTSYNTLLLGADVFYYSPESHQKHLSVLGQNLELDDIDSRLAAFTIGNELHFGKLSFLFQAGFYLYDKHHVWSSWYQRYAFKYAITKNIFIQPSLLSHSRTANMIEWGAGVSF